MNRWALLLGLALLAAGAGIAWAGSVQPRNGDYDGGAADVAVWFDVRGGEVERVQIHADYSTCNASFTIFESDKPDANGRFLLQRDFVGDSVTFKGRFKTPTRVEGKVIWNQDDACAEGDKTFEYRARRVKVP
jgi:hypothetical protein